MKTIICLTLMIACTVNLLIAGTYYVSPNGSDSDSGTELKPWKTIQHAANTLKAGDLVYIKAGTYKEMVHLNQHSGTIADYITFSAYPGDEGMAIVDGTGIQVPAYTGLIYLDQVNYIEIKGLNIRNSKEAGILVDYSTHILISGCRIFNTHSSGIGVWDCSYVFIDDNNIDHACMGNQGGAPDIQECLTVSNTKTFEVSNNKVHDNNVDLLGGEGIDVKEECENGQVYNNEVYNLMYDLGIYVDAWSSTCQNIDVFNNKVYNTSIGIALSSEDGGVLQQIQLYNNIILNNRENGIVISNWEKNGLRKDINIINNTVFQNGETDSWGGGIFVETTNVENIKIINNIVSDNAEWQIAVNTTTNIVVDHNLVYQFKGWNDPGEVEVKGTNCIESDPMFAGIAIEDFHLITGSPCIDAGSSANAPDFDFDYLIRPFDGNNDGTALYDIGAYEFGSTPSDIHEEEVMKSNIGQIFPNPVKDYFYLSIKGSISKDLQVSLVDLYGNILIVLEQQNVGHGQIKISLPDLAEGSYLIIVTYGKERKIEKLIIQ